MMPDNNVDYSRQLITNLVSLPREVQSMIASFLLRPSDLNALSRTCKTLRDTSLPRLYRRVEVRIPARHFRMDALENLLKGSENGLKSTRELRILPQQGPLHDSGRTKLDNRDNVEDARDYHPESRASSLFNILIRQLISKIPFNCLQKFEWRHICSIDMNTLALLLERQQPRCLRLEGFIVDLTRHIEISVRPGLRELRFGSLETVQSVDWMSNTVATNSSTLQHLEIGVENSLVMSVVQDQSHNDLLWAGRFRQKLETRLADIYGPSYPFLSVSSLTLVGLDLLDLESKSRPMFDWTSISSLALKSCLQLVDTLNFLKTAIFRPSWSRKSVSLKSFDLRLDNRANTTDSGVVAEALKDFLTSFDGLVHLGLLLEDPNIPSQISSSMLDTILANHGSTLRSLVWDVRMQERTLITNHPSREQFGNDHLIHILRWCPLLEQLGLFFDWPAFEKKTTWEKVMERLGALNHLRTLHIRNLPSLRQEESKLSWPSISDDERSEVLITRLVREILKRRSEQPPTLEFIALGLLMYKDVCAGKAFPYENERLDEFLKLRVYHVQYQRGFLGEFVPTITLIAKGTADDIQGICHNIHIIQLDWMA